VQQHQLPLRLQELTPFLRWAALRVQREVVAAWARKPQRELAQQEFGGLSPPSLPASGPQRRSLHLEPQRQTPGLQHLQTAADLPHRPAAAVAGLQRQCASSWPLLPS